MKQGPIPQHVAFIMDGNRRFARKNHVVTSGGHRAGFHKLTDVLEWCNDLGIKHVSVFAFAINNFKRSTDEVTALMALARDKLRVLAEKSDLVKKHGLRIRVAGSKDMLPEDVRESITFAEESTKDNTGMTLNVCFPYSATDEISTAIRTLVEDVDSGKLMVADVSEKSLEERLHIPGPELDILVRTSGEIRFSNYMLWQSSKMAYLKFVNAYWPEFSLWHMLSILVSWQLSHDLIKQRKAQRRDVSVGSGASAVVSDSDT
ncbi:dehydrodolichyl diphosphate synthase [Linderina pennispora]|uniref:Alkyl transferase n=1 Tax=Linderina pennispora TaxID=61395 RepID=A0A1Y1W3R3_9FUNG|nr:dehydrodolichyl diphosphate synthase [Linderina pennispora]ORX68032.1 dehydrodolichyl diphosphate synthase [Linderina pennispora]